ncbi:MAG: MarR family transcriptional regulator [Caulobacter sp.]|nr:MarR family transcriptional regulator [Caulobacter sp.]
MSHLTPAGLDSHLGFWLRYVSNHVSQAFARKLEGEGVTVAEWVVIRELFETEALAPSRLAGRMGMTRGAISKLSDRLVNKALVLRRDDPRDGRARSLALTPAARTLVSRLAALADLNESEFFGDLADEDRRTLERILRQIVERRGLKTLPVD